MTTYGRILTCGASTWQRKERSDTAPGGTPTTLILTDNGDGTFNASGDAVTDNGDGNFTLNYVGVTDNGDGTYTAVA